MLIRRISYLGRLLSILSLFITFSNIYCQFAGGSGTESDPFQVATAAHLNNVRNYLSAYFIQVADIDLAIAPYNSGGGWVPIGITNIPFTGNYNGNGCNVYNLFIYRTTTNYQGLFGVCKTLDNVCRISDLNLQNSVVTGQSYVGSLCGEIFNGVEIINCTVTGEVFGNYMVGGLVGYSIIQNKISYSSFIGSVSGYLLKIGGLVGQNFRQSIINHCFTGGNVTCYGSNHVGGLAGANYSDYGEPEYECIISNSYSLANVSGNDCVGGLVGFNTNSRISNCYARGDVDGQNGVGGLLGSIWDSGGFSTIENCYTSGVVSGLEYTGGLIGHSTTSNYYVISSYWNTETSGQSTSFAGAGRTTAEMTYPYADSTYTGWDFGDVWFNDVTYQNNNGYPCLRDMQYTSVADNIISKPTVYLSNYPNPFSESTVISFNLTKGAALTLKVYNPKGQLIRTLVNGYKTKGEHKIPWDGKDSNGTSVGKGMYLYRLESQDLKLTSKLILLD